MSSQLTTLDHKIMGLLLKSHDGVAIQTLIRGSKASKSNVLTSVYKLADMGFVRRRVMRGASPLYVAVLDAPYFAPVAARDFLAFDDAELTDLVDALAPVLAASDQ